MNLFSLYIFLIQFLLIIFLLSYKFYLNKIFRKPILHGFYFSDHENFQNEDYIFHQFQKKHNKLTEAIIFILFVQLLFQLFIYYF
jgi:hypothetical protein